jgi:hypothetical protein
MKIYAKALIDGKSHWGCIPVFSEIMNLLSIAAFRLTEADLHQKYFKFRTKKVHMQPV